MEVKVNVKHMGKQKKSVEPKSYRLSTAPTTVRELILAVVEAGVREYNERLENQKNQDSGELLKCLTRQEIEDQAETGKVSFGTLYGEKGADLKQAQDNAIQCFEDGIYRVFLDGRPLEELEEEIGGALDGKTCGGSDGETGRGVFTFVRLTMLSGRMW